MKEINLRIERIHNGLIVVFFPTQGGTCDRAVFAATQADIAHIIATYIAEKNL